MFDNGYYLKFFDINIHKSIFLQDLESIFQNNYY